MFQPSAQRTHPLQTQASVLPSSWGRHGPIAEIGAEPPIEADGRRHTAEDHRHISLRWLSGTILTGLTGALLIGAAVYSALDGESHFAEPPTPVTPRAEKSDALVNPRKGDRLVKSVDIVAAKQTFRTPTVVKAGDKEVIRSRGFTKVSTTLTLNATGFADEVPPFNPLKVLTGARNGVEQIPEAALPAQDDAEVSFVTRDLNSDQTPFSAAALSLPEVQAQVIEHVKNMISAGTKPSLALPAQLLLMRTSRAGLGTGDALAYANVGEPLARSPFSSIEVRMIPENVTLVPKAEALQQPTQMEERLVVVRRGESFEDVLAANNVPREKISSIVAALKGKRNDMPSEGRRLKLLYADFDGSGKNMQLARISVYIDDRLEAMAAISDRGEYMQVAIATPQQPGAAKPANEEEDEEQDSGGMRLYDSLYETALKQEIPRPVIDDLVRIFANDVDFQRAVSGGDSFDAFYSEPDDVDGREELLFASITARNETFKYYRFQTPDDGLIDFYDENGRSTRKFLVRKPIAWGEMRSGFGYRRHPILGYAKMHTGVDWAAPIGTPIFAAGNGTITKAAWDAGYGRRVEIQHANGYVTAYNHMSGFARGIREGLRIKQGQVLGFLGSSGLSTGPHLHYEVMVNGHFVDPMRVKLARTREFDGKMLSMFTRERDRIEGLMAKAPNATASLARRQSAAN
jgi:murein DD-endopeptidase MepM/ murein hydrolase activator NlpD